MPQQQNDLRDSCSLCGSSLLTLYACMQRGMEIGVDMDVASAAATAPVTELDARLAAAADPCVSLPDYYCQPFHAYPKGNLSWDAAFEVEAAARSVHATVMDPANVAVQSDGDARMRASYHAKARELLEQEGHRDAVADVQRVVDLGSAVGLSSLAAAAAFPGATVQGVFWTQGCAAAHCFVAEFGSPFDQASNTGVISRSPIASTASLSSVLCMQGSDRP